MPDCTPFVESLQMIVVTPREHQRFKFTLDRHEFLAGRLGLKPLGKDDPVDTSSFESVLLPNRMALAPSETDPPSESLIALRYKTLREIPSSLESCVRCHGGTTVQNQIFGFTRPPKAAFLQSDPDEAAATIVKKKEASDQWKSYLRLRTAQAK